MRSKLPTSTNVAYRTDWQNENHLPNPGRPFKTLLKAHLCSSTVLTVGELHHVRFSVLTSSFNQQAFIGLHSKPGTVLVIHPKKNEKYCSKCQRYLRDSLKIFWIHFSRTKIYIFKPKIILFLGHTLHQVIFSLLHSALAPKGVRRGAYLQDVVGQLNRKDVTAWCGFVIFQLVYARLGWQICMGQLRHTPLAFLNHKNVPENWTLWIDCGITWLPQSMAFGSDWQTMVVTDASEFSLVRQTAELLVVPDEGLNIIPRALLVLYAGWAVDWWWEKSPTQGYSISLHPNASYYHHPLPPTNLSQIPLAATTSLFTVNYTFTEMGGALVRH